MRSILFFDLETAANADALARMPAPVAPSNYKDPEKIDASVADKRAAISDRAALDADLCRILAVSFCHYPYCPVETLLGSVQK